MLYRRKDSKLWYCSFFHKGKRVRLSTGFVDKRKARDRAVQLQANYRPRQRPKTDLDRLVNEYLDFASSDHSKDTYRFDRMTLDKFLKFAGKKKLEPLLFEKYKRERALSVSKATVNRELDVLRSMCNLAVDWRLLEKNPYRVKKFKDDSQAERVKFFTHAQVDLLLTKSRGTPLHDIILFAVNTGLRRSELVYLTWNDIDLDTWRVTVQAKPKLGWKPKNRRARTVPIPKQCHSMLLERKAKSLSLFVFPNTLGGLKDKDNLTRELRGLLKRVGLYSPHLGCHTLRHSFASRLVLKGVALYKVAKLLGHSNEKTTELYAHLQPRDLEDAIERIDFGRGVTVTETETQTVSRLRAKEAKKP